jgi:hypothetical protein
MPWWNPTLAKNARMGTRPLFFPIWRIMYGEEKTNMLISYALGR